jgi:hypothetical protein
MKRLDSDIKALFLCSKCGNQIKVEFYSKEFDCSKFFKVYPCTHCKDISVLSKLEWNTVYRGYIIRDKERGASYIGSYTGRSWVTEKRNAERFTKQEALEFLEAEYHHGLDESQLIIEDAI